MKITCRSPITGTMTLSVLLAIGLCVAHAQTLTAQQQLAFDMELVEINAVTATGDTAADAYRPGR